MPRSIQIVLLALLLVSGVSCRKAAPPSPELGTPMLALKSLEGGTVRSLYCNVAKAPQLEEWQGTVESNESVAHNPKAWRALNREKRFDAVLLLDDPAAYKPLLTHLQESPDWVLSHVDATSILFRRAPRKAWTPDDLVPLKTVFETHSRQEQVLFRVQTAHRLIALNDMTAARALLDEAIKIDGKSAPAWAELSFWHASQGQWSGAVVAADQAYAFDPNYTPAVTAKANAYFAQGRFNDALKLTTQLVEKFPDNGPTLYLHAKVARAAHAYTQEIKVLKKIIELAETNSLPTGTWRVYLGQALASTGQASAALKEFETALSDSTLHDHERAFATKAIQRLKDE